MDMFGINGWFLFIQAIPVILIIGLPIISLVGLAKKKMSGTPLVIWALIIMYCPVVGGVGILDRQTNC